MEANLTASAASAIKQSQVRNEAAFVVAKKTLSAQKQAGEAAVELIKQVEQVASQVSGGHLDVRA